MTALQAGLLCASMMLSACSCLYCCISTAVHKLLKAHIVHLSVFLANAVALAVLLAQLPACEKLSPLPWTGAAALLMAVSAGIMRHISQVSIKTGCDHLPCALCFALANGRPCLKNLKMDALSHHITGEALLNANLFWEALAEQPVVTLENGQTWSFERTAMEIDGQTVFQIIGTDVTESVRLNRELEADNRQLDAMNQRLREYSLNVQAVAREKETLRAKVRIHDELGHALLQTRQFLSDGREDADDIRASWRQNIRFLLGEHVDEAQADSFRQLLSAAQAVGVTIDRHGVFPAEGTENAHLAETAIHESLTNLVRHANGRHLEILGTKESDGWHICFQNDGAAPAGPIVEGGGLSSLRDQVEAAGGTMRIDCAPRFLLTLILPEETERLFR